VRSVGRALWLALAQKGQPTTSRTLQFSGDRERIRTLASYVALKMVADAACAHGRA
jgi:nicotinamide-nucleotide amidase